MPSSHIVQDASSDRRGDEAPVREAVKVHRGREHQGAAREVGRKLLLQAAQGEGLLRQREDHEAGKLVIKKIKHILLH